MRTTRRDTVIPRRVLTSHYWLSIRLFRLDTGSGLSDRERVILLDTQQQKQIEQQLRQNWTSIKHQILDQFAQVSTADLDAATNVQDLVQRIADRSNYSERLVETKLSELVGVGSSSSSNSLGGSQQPYGQQSSQRKFSEATS